MHAEFDINSKNGRIVQLIGDDAVALAYTLLSVEWPRPRSASAGDCAGGQFGKFRCQCSDMFLHLPDIIDSITELMSFHMFHTKFR